MTEPGLIAESLADADARAEQLAKVAKELGRALRQARTAIESPASYSEVLSASERLTKSNAALESLGLRVDPLARIEEAVQALLERVRAANRDVLERRTAVRDAAVDAGLTFTSLSQTREVIAGFTVDHSPEVATISFGKYRLGKLAFPSGAEVVKALVEQQTALREQAVSDLWPKLLEHNAKDGHSLPWTDAIAVVSPEEPKRRKAEPGLCYLVALLVSGEGPGRWSAATSAPALQQQSGAITVPRLDRPSDSLRVFAFKLTPRREPVP